ncbi:hypothetical protein PTSG_07930 [Salpingoeca rosetta]|uniref:Spondin-like TSP1 domain-containing protein n=1 Tax=Salpingoeca rosetta (strain ATCC 50818 / BSB-021) TaxID=946362 RepID=F2UGR2_SALR5|nr:uncharacterized protein PTSG_07930 [Salpingoeca rosetta]EGD75812.1 hypothetical protein PTSG_07930 [Salpingoeca rosetta]|eukprot:XP_004991733.1 hypothetical protein PTSG_07930 [Salpingoeca rosetta]
MRVKKVAVALLTAAVLSLVTLAVRRLFHSPDITQPPDEVQKEDGTSCDAGRWSDWSLCDKKCVRHRRRLQSQYDQLQPLCDPVVQQQTCPAAWCTPSQQSMHSEDCATPWSNWSPCSATCGIGYRVRSREGTSNGPCILHESEKCADLPPCPLITCDSPHQATNLDDMYFAKGYAKTAWRGEYMGNPVVIKRPVTESDLHLQRFMAGMQAEAKWLQELSPLSQHIMRFYGSCDQGEHPFSVVEGNLAKFDWLSRVLEMLKSSEKDVCGAAGGAAQLSQHDREVLHKAFAANMRSSHDRCKKRYC